MQARKLNEPVGFLVSSLNNLGSRKQVKSKEIQNKVGRTSIYMNYVASSTRRKSISFLVLTVESVSFSLEHLSFLNELGGPAKCPFKATSVCLTPSQEAGSTPPRSFSSKHILQPKGSPTTQNHEMSQTACDADL